MIMTPQEEHINWLKKQKKLAEEELLTAKSAMAKVKALVAEKEVNLGYFVEALNQFSVCEKATEKLFEQAASTQRFQRSPKQMLKPQYRKMTLAEIAADILTCNKPLSIKAIASQIFDSLTNEEWNRAKNSLGTELRRGVKLKRWKKFSRGIFIQNE